MTTEKRAVDRGEDIKLLKEHLCCQRKKRGCEKEREGGIRKKSGIIRIT